MLHPLNAFLGASVQGCRPFEQIGHEKVLTKSCKSQVLEISSYLFLAMVPEFGNDLLIARTKVHLQCQKIT